MPPILACVSASTFLTASLEAATIMSCNISTSPATSGSIFTVSRFFCPSMVTVTMPPPAEASTLTCAISCCSFSCICCAWRIICCICCMLPGSFMWLLLEVSNFSNFAAKYFAEALHFGIGQRAGGDFVFVGARRVRLWRNGRGLRARLADGHFNAHRTPPELPDRLVQIVGSQRQRVGLGGDELQLASGFHDARVL